ncbi:uracil-DNA glycosylase [Paenibacillus albiflavus]|uniref:Uracil-DNA glycosylase n=1 Tax=Paenibacillus albiflavus TaxID=2545760 RepID=A0A4V2WPW5_9BACL|nr:uracil-DNA glycosylase [Paenibacillus albiflavus]TCZ80972.1 uracil-DNA glycosylase [Paenibacillus albiflavus]
MLIPQNIHSSWKNFLNNGMIRLLSDIESKLGPNINPTRPDVILRFMTIDLDKVKVVWLGQDVYPAEGVATGRSFEVGGLTDWNSTFRQVSLKNIVRLIHKTYNDIHEYSDIKGFKEIQGFIKQGEFPILHPVEWFQSLEQQGVLFLNTSFTCEVGKPNSHKALWTDFSEQVLAYISIVRPDLVWFLWGKEAIANKQFLRSGVLKESRHPMMCSEKYEDDFLKSDCFKSTMSDINWLG